ncbi:hypothetical protein BH10PSE19_BH10PSE19_12700 [soil metagenome]
MKANNKAAAALKSWLQEKNSVYLYKVISQRAPKSTQRELFLHLAKEAEKQAIEWQHEVEKNGSNVPTEYRLSIRIKILAWLIQRFGPQSLHTILSAAKIRGMSIFSQPRLGHPMPKTIADVEQQRKSASTGNNLRAAVFGVNDGLISNASLIMGMAGTHADSNVIVFAGIAGLFAGAFSMAAGEFVSVKSQREMFEYQINLEKKELELYPQEEAAELALIYQARGLSKEEATKVTNQLMQDPNNALDTLAREELGLDPSDLVSPYSAASYSFLAFIIGAAIPLAPFLFGHHKLIMPLSIGLTASCLFIIGAILSLYTGLSAIKNGLKMLFIGSTAGAATYLIGRVIGITLN